MELVLLKEDTSHTFSLPPAPKPWLRLHSLATSASLASGGLAFSLTYMAGNTLTKTLCHSITIGGSLLAYAGRWIGGDLLGLGIQAGAQTTAAIMEQVGETTTQMSAIVASTAAAVTVGSAFLIGNTLYDLYSESTFSKPLFVELPTEFPIQLIESIEELPDLDTEYIVYATPDRDSGIVSFDTISLSLEGIIEVGEESTVPSPMKLGKEYTIRRSLTPELPTDLSSPSALSVSSVLSVPSVLPVPTAPVVDMNTVD